MGRALDKMFRAGGLIWVGILAILLLGPGCAGRFCLNHSDCAFDEYCLESGVSTQKLCLPACRFELGEAGCAAGQVCRSSVIDAPGYGSCEPIVCGNLVEVCGSGQTCWPPPLETGDGESLCLDWIPCDSGTGACSERECGDGNVCGSVSVNRPDGGADLVCGCVPPAPASLAE